MEDGLVRNLLEIYVLIQEVLILVVVDDGLVLERAFAQADGSTCLNPCCSGRWSRTPRT